MNTDSIDPATDEGPPDPVQSDDTNAESSPEGPDTEVPSVDASGYQPPPPIRRLRRSPNGPLGGVAGGLAEYLGVDAVLIRIAAIVLTAFGGFGLLLYMAAWFLLPNSLSTDPRPIAITPSVFRMIGGSVFLLGAASSLAGTLSFGIDGGAFLAIALLAAGFYILNQRATSELPPGSGPPTWQPVATTPTAASTPGSPLATPGTPTPPVRPAASAHWASPRLEGEGPGGIAAMPPPSMPAPPLPPGPPRPPVTSITLAVTAVAIGILAIVDQATSADISATVYFAAATAIIGAGLIVSSFVGRALSLIPIGLLAISGLVVAPIADNAVSGGFGERDIRVADDANLEPTYELGAGSIDLDLRDLELTTDRTVALDVGAGYAEVRLPEDTNLVIKATNRFGYIEVFGRERAGVNNSFALAESPVIEGPILTVELDVTFGYVEVRR